MAKMLSDTRCRNILNKEINELYSEVQQMDIGFYEDEIGENTYAYIYELEGEHYRLYVERETGSVHHVNVRKK